MSTDKRNWKIIYSDYSGPEKKAVELINKEMGSIILRDAGAYTLHVLECEKADRAVTDKNAVILGTYYENEIIRNYINLSEIPENGYVVKVMDSDASDDLKLVIITALSQQNIFYGAVDFVDDYFNMAAPKRGSLTFGDELFDHRLPDYYKAASPSIETRSIFTWGHPINDYMAYIDNMARLRLNELIIWNDYVPVNAGEIVQYAHEYGIKVIWGYSWGWSRNCKEIDFDNIDTVIDEAVKKYETEYANAAGDGIYFQSFTELRDEYIGEKLIAEAVTDFVNKTADCILKKYPALDIRFGLHATSVKNHLEFLKQIDKRVTIIWEDCGAFPYDYEPSVKNSGEFEKALEFTNAILGLREGCSDGVLYKGQVTLDWVGEHFAHQSGPFILGRASQKLIDNDIELLKPLWKPFQSQWLTNGIYAHKMTQYIKSIKGSGSMIGMAAQLAGGIWFPEALCAHIIWNCDKSYDDILTSVSAMRYVKMV